MDGQYNVDNEDVLGRGLDPKSYVGDEGGALWRGLCLAKGEDVKTRPFQTFSISNKTSTVIPFILATKKVKRNSNQ